MSWRQRWNNVFRSGRLNDDLDNEFQYHLAETTDRLIAEGIPEEEAWLQARLRLGNYHIQKERTRDMNILAWLEATKADLLYGLRQLRSNPGFTTIAILSLALGIGANTAIFQLVDAIRLRALPVQNPQELATIDFEGDAVKEGSAYSDSATSTYPQWEQIRAHQQAFSGMLAWGKNRFNLTNGGEPRYAEGLYVSGDFFRVLGVPTFIGRTLATEDDKPGCSAVAVISYPFWQREFGSDPNILNHTVSLDGHSVPIIGVTPPTFFGLQVGSRYDVAIPLCSDPQMGTDNRNRLENRQAWWLCIIGRLKPGWTVERAATHLHALSPGIMRATLPPRYFPKVAQGYLSNRLTALPGSAGTSLLREQYERPLWLLMATTGLVLLIACANLANLLLARATVREREIAVRLAIGASRSRLLRQLLSESLLLAIFGAALGTGLAVTLSRALIGFLTTSNNPVFVDIALDVRVLAFTVALAVLTCVLFGLLPALRASWLSPVAAMRSGSRSVSAGSKRFGIRRALVSLQVALSVVLLFGALLFTRTLYNLLTIDPGFRADGILSVQIDFTKAHYPVERRTTVYRELSDRLSALPGVSSIARVYFTPVSGMVWGDLVNVDGPATNGKMSAMNRIGPGYFHTMGARLLAGREFTDRDTLATPEVAIVNEAFARTFFAGANPVGRTFHGWAEPGKPEPIYEIVGMAGNSKYMDLREDFMPIAFFPTTQNRFPGPRGAFVMRISGSPTTIINEASSAVRSMNPALSIESHQLSQQLKESLLRERLMATLSAGFGFLAVLLATLGLYGVVSYLVASRRNEIGVRIALGASRTGIIRLVLHEAILLTAIGLTAGTALALWAGKAAATLLFGLKPYDALSLLAVCALLAAIALLASFVPARRAASLDPMATLRND